MSLRIVQYEQMSDDSGEVALVFVNEEIELYPERAGFYNNYRRLCSTVVEWICYAYLPQATEYILNQVDSHLDEVERDEVNFNPQNFTRVTPNYFRAEAQFTMLDAAFKGMNKYQTKHRETTDEEDKRKIAEVHDKMKVWASRLLEQRSFRDPYIRMREMKTVVEEISHRALSKDTGFAFKALEHVMSAFVPKEPGNLVYAEAVADLHAMATAELRRLSLTHADYFVTFYDQLATQFSQLAASNIIDGKVQVDLRSSLFLVVQRATNIDPVQQKSRLWQSLEPLLAAWSNSILQAGLSSFESFTEYQKFTLVAPYMRQVNAKQFSDWAEVPIDDHGLQIQTEMTEAFNQMPLRETRVLLSVSTERLVANSDMHRTVQQLWLNLMPVILKSILQLTNFNHKLHDSSLWPNSSTDMQDVIARILRDRYWQSGISEGSMADFHSRVKSSKGSLEGFASSVRGRIRSNLENCYSIIHTLGRLGEEFYNHEQIPEMISEALLSSSTPLSPHHFAVILSMLPKLIEECPPAHRQHFLTPILSTLLQQMDTKCVQEWQKLDSRKQTKTDDDNLSDEMRDDSVLRQMTSKAVNMVSTWLNPQREAQIATKKSIVNGIHASGSENTQTMHAFILSNVRILEPLLMFATHSLSFKDLKACNIMIAASQRLVHAYSTEDFLSGAEVASVREFIASELLKTAITCLNDGYYADVQAYLAELIATIWISYGLPTHIAANETTGRPAHDRPPLTDTPRNILLSLPGMSEAKINGAAEKLYAERGGKSKRVRAIILSLLEGVRGVRLSELGKIDTRATQNRIAERYKQREALGMQGVEEGRRGAEGGVNDGVDLTCV
jgi:exportin-5